MIKLLKSKPDIDLPDHIVVKRSARARRMALKLDTKNRVFTLTLPRGMSLRRAQRFAEEHESWMQKCLQDLAPPILFENGVRIPILGQLTTIRIERDFTLKRTSIALLPPSSLSKMSSPRKRGPSDMRQKDPRLHGESRRNDGWVLLVRTQLEDPSPRIKRYLKKLAKEHLSDMAHEKAARIDKTINKIHIRDTKTRWGSCSEDGNLNFSWRLILAPYEAFDYVVAHEVAHLKHLDHSKAFWAVCRTLSDDYIEGKYWMDEHGQELMRFG